MNGFVIVGTDTNAGKTTFSLLFLSAFAEQFDYWKPVETGESDTERVRKLVPEVGIHEPLARFHEPVAPCLAARLEGKSMPGVAEIIAAIPASSRPLLIESFGGPLSPLTNEVLQIELIRAFQLPVVLVTCSAVGAVGRTSGDAVQGDGGRFRREDSVAVVLRYWVKPDPFAVRSRSKSTRAAFKCTLSVCRVPDGEWDSGSTVMTRAAGECKQVFANQGVADQGLTPQGLTPLAINCRPAGAKTSFHEIRVP